MSKIDHLLIRTVLNVSVLGILAIGISAQTTIFNIPTADTLPRKSWNLEGDLVTKPVSYDKGGFQSYGYRVAYGLTHKTEIGSNFYYSWNGSQSTGQAEFSYKRKLYLNERYGVSVSAGGVAFMPLKARNGDRTSVMIYGNARKTISSLRGMTVTSGAYHVFRGSRQFGTRTGTMLGVVQPLNRKFSFVADWYSGNNRLGYASAGFNYNITKRQYLLAGYSFGNSGRGNNALAAYYGYTF